MFQNWPKFNRLESNQTVVERLRKERRNRFRILVCIDGTKSSYEGLKIASEIKPFEQCDIILLYVRSIDQGLRTGGLEMKIARENMLEWGLELPGLEFLKDGLNMLVDEKELLESWKISSSHTESWGDPVGDNKVEYKHVSGRSIVLKLKTAPDPASGILDQYELGPYNLIVMGAPDRWRSEFKAFFGAPVAQKVATLSPCSVLLARDNINYNSMRDKGHLICVSGSPHSIDAMQRDAVLAHNSGYNITLFTVVGGKGDIIAAEKELQKSVDLLSKIGIKVLGVTVGVGNPVQEIVKEGAEFSIISVAASSKEWYKRFFTTGVAFNVMATSDTTVLNVR